MPTFANPYLLSGRLGGAGRLGSPKTAGRPSGGEAAGAARNERRRQALPLHGPVKGGVAAAPPPPAGSKARARSTLPG